MNKEDYIKIAKRKIKRKSAKLIMINQIEKYYNAIDSYKPKKNNYKIGDDVFLKKGTLLHGTYKNLEGLEEIVKNGLISSIFINARISKYPSSVGVWNLKKDYYLKDYINFYSGGTVKFFNHENDKKETQVLSYDEIGNVVKYNYDKDQLVWQMEQTKEARFLPSLSQNIVQIGIIFNGQCKETKELLTGDILSDKISDKDMKDFVVKNVYYHTINGKKNKDDFFTDRESAILFGLPSCLIEGILVGRKYEKDENILEKIKTLLPNCYICNLDGKIIF